MGQCVLSEKTHTSQVQISVRQAETHRNQMKAGFRTRLQHPRGLHNWIFKKPVQPVKLSGSYKSAD